MQVLMAPLRKWFFTGLLVIVPGAITVAVLNWIVGLLDQTLLILPVAWHPDRLLGFHIPGFGVLLTLLILLVVGGTTSKDDAMVAGAGPVSSAIQPWLLSSCNCQSPSGRRTSTGAVPPSRISDRYPPQT